MQYFGGALHQLRCGQKRTMYAHRLYKPDRRALGLANQDKRFSETRRPRDILMLDSQGINCRSRRKASGSHDRGQLQAVHVISSIGGPAIIIAACGFDTRADLLSPSIRVSCPTSRSTWIDAQRHSVFNLHCLARGSVLTLQFKGLAQCHAACPPASPTNCDRGRDRLTKPGSLES